MEILIVLLVFQLSAVVVSLAILCDRAKTIKSRLIEIRKQDRDHQQLVGDWWRTMLRNMR